MVIIPYNSHIPTKHQTPTMTYTLRPLHLRLANGVAKTKGYNGAALNPWRTSKSQVKRFVNDHLGPRYINDGPGGKPSKTYTAKGLPAEVKEVDNSGDCVGGCPEWTQAQRQAAADQNKRTWTAKGCETPEPWQHTVKEAPVLSLRRKARLAGVGATHLQCRDLLHVEVTPGPAIKLGQVSLTQTRKMTRAERISYEYPQAVVVDHTKTLDYPHGELVNVPHPNHTCMAWGGWRGQAQAQTFKQGTQANLINTLSLDGMAESILTQAWEEEGVDAEITDLSGETPSQDQSPVKWWDKKETLEWAESITKATQWEAVRLWAMGKSLSQVAVVQATSKATAQKRVERTLARIQMKMASN